MDKKEKEILLAKEAFTMNFDLTEKGQERRPENISRVQVEVYERVNDKPVFVVYERNDSPQRYTPEQREMLIDWAIEQYELEPALVKFYEKKRDAELYHPVRVYQLPYVGETEGKKLPWTIKTQADDTDISKKELAGIIRFRDFTAPDLGPRVEPGPRIERPHIFSDLKMPPVPPGSDNDHTIPR